MINKLYLLQTATKGLENGIGKLDPIEMYAFQVSHALNLRNIGVSFVYPCHQLPQSH